MRNRPEWLVAFIAITALGAVPVLVNSRGVAAELAYSLTYTRCRHLIADERCAALLASGLNDAALQGVVVGARAGRVCSLAHLREPPAGAAPAEPAGH